MHKYEFYIDMIITQRIIYHKNNSHHKINFVLRVRSELQGNTQMIYLAKDIKIFN